MYEIIEHFVGSFFASNKDLYKEITVEEMKEKVDINNKRFEELMSMIVIGDKLYFYRSSDKSWNQLAGMEGYLLMREGKQIAFVPTVIN